MALESVKVLVMGDESLAAMRWCISKAEGFYAVTAKRQYLPKVMLDPIAGWFSR